MHRPSSYPSLERRPLSGHTSRGVVNISGLPAFLFGLPFAAAGLLVIAVFSGFWEIGDTSGDAPAVVVIPIGTVFAAVGFGLMGFGVRTSLAKAAFNRRKRKNPGQYWLWDHPWRPEGESTRVLGSLVKGFVFFVLFGAFLTPFNWLAFGLEFLGLPPSNEQVPIWVMGLVGVFDLVWIALIVAMIYAMLQALRYGNSRLRYDSFPFFLGDDLQVTLVKGPKLQRFTSIEISLRCVEEAFESSSSGGSRSSGVVAYAVYEDRRLLEEQDIRHLFGSELPISFPLPTDPLATRLGERPPRYWEVELKGEAPGVDYSATFLVPVYARS